MLRPSLAHKTPLVPNPVIYTTDRSHMLVSHLGTISTPNMSLHLYSKLFPHFSNRGIDAHDRFDGPAAKDRP
jgi:hypothetical protein